MNTCVTQEAGRCTCVEGRHSCLKSPCIICKMGEMRDLCRRLNHTSAGVTSCAVRPLPRFWTDTELYVESLRCSPKA